MNVITEEKIIEAAEKLIAEGKNPTQVSVRAALGGGSFATIGPVLKEWKEGKKEDYSFSEIVVPAIIAERFSQLQGAIWEAAVNEAETRLTAEREALKTAQDAAAAEVAEQKESVAMLETEADQLKKTIDEMESIKKAQLADIQSLEANLASVSNAAAIKIAELTVKLDSANNAANNAAEQAKNDLKELKAEHKTELENIKQDTDKQLRHVIEQAKNDFEKLKTEHKAEVKSQQAATNQQKTDFEAILKTKDENAQLLKSKLANAENLLATAQANEKNLNTELMTEVKNAATASGQVIELEKQLSALQTKAKPAAAKAATNKPQVAKL